MLESTKLEAYLGATHANDFPHQTNSYGQTGDCHARSGTDLDGAERLTGVYGSEAGAGVCAPGSCMILP